MNRITRFRFRLMLFCIANFHLLFSQSPIAFGKDTTVIFGSDALAKKWLKANLLAEKTANDLPSPTNPGYYIDSKHTVTFADKGKIDNCGYGTITRTYTITSDAGITTVDFKYISENRNAFTVTFPKNDTIYVKDDDNFTIKYSEPVVSPIVGTLVGVEYTDACLITPFSYCNILRTWRVLNWCQPLDLNADKGELRRVGQDCEIQPRTYTCIDTLLADRKTSVFAANSPFSLQMKAIAAAEKCYQYDTDGYLENYQTIRIIDTIPPKIRIMNKPEFTNSNCEVKLKLFNQEVKDHLSIVSFKYQIIDKNTKQVIATGSTFPISYTFSETGNNCLGKFGHYIIRYLAEDVPGNIGREDIYLEVKPTTMPKLNTPPIKEYNVTNEPSYIYAKDLGATATSCYLPLTYKISGYTSWISNIPSDSLLLPKCVGSQPITLYVSDKYDNQDSCYLYILMSNNLGIPNIPHCVCGLPTNVANDIENNKFKILSNQPNPFKTETNIIYEVPEAEVVTFQVFDVLGQKVFEDQIQSTVGRNEYLLNQNDLKKGVLFYSLIYKGITRNGKLLKIE